MAVVNVFVPRRPDQVWDVLADGHAYADWVIGTREIRVVDDGWPALGTSISYTVGWGPLALRGRTTVRQVENGRRLGLEADAGLLGRRASCSSSASRATAPSSSSTSTRCAARRTGCRAPSPRRCCWCAAGRW